MHKDGCVFCEIVRKEIPAKIVFQNDRILAFEDVNPKAPVHILVIPKFHIEKISDLTEGDTHLAGELVLTAKALADKSPLCGSGYRIILNCDKDAGQEVFHLHLHLMGGRKFTWPPG